MRENESHRDEEESVRHAQWVREHPQIDDSGFPEYPDELPRRGSSRGAVPNGNPWRPVDPDDTPGRPAWDADTEPNPGRTDGEGVNGDVTRTDGEPGAGEAATASSESSELAAPAPVLDEPAHEPAIVIARNEGDERIGQDIGDVLAASKSLDGKYVLVEIVDGEVYLHGTVTDQAVRSEVEQLASSVRGVGRIHNELDVRQ
jgi:osmotically-inducible protein OsmY